MSFSNPQMILSHLGNAVKPWNSSEARDVQRIGTYERVKTVDQAEIDACLECPFPSCDGNFRKCRSYRAHAEAEARRKNASVRTSRH
jgi:hypothetical protein